MDMNETTTALLTEAKRIAGTMFSKPTQATIMGIFQYLTDNYETVISTESAGQTLH